MRDAPPSDAQPLLPLAVAALVAAAAAAALAPTVGALASTPTLLQPGDAVTSAEGTPCTLGFVLDGPHATYIGTAAHCLDPEVEDRAHNDRVGEFGTVVYDNDDPTVDLALVEVDDELEANVDGAVAGHPEAPTGVADPDGTEPGDRLHLAGQGLVVSRTEPTREERPSFLVEHNDTGYRSNGPVVNGDSGAPLVHAETGTALGTVSRYGVPDVPPTTDKGPTVQHLLDVLREDGFDVTLRTAG